MIQGLSFLFRAGVDNIYALLTDPRQRWEYDCQYCEATHTGLSPTSALLKSSLHHHREMGDEDPHPTPDEMSDEDWQNPEGTPRLVAGSTSYPVDESGTLREDATR